MKKTVLLFLLAAFVFSCADESENVSEEQQKQEPDAAASLDGSWMIQRGIGPYADRQVGQVYSFKGDKFQFNKGALYFTGTVVYEKNAFILTPAGKTNAKRFYYEMKADTMIMKMEGSELTFYLTKIITGQP